MSKSVRPPSEDDIVYGKGGGVVKHPGNHVLRLLVFLNKELYDSCPREEQRLVSLSIVESLRRDGRRFMKKDPEKGVWEEVGVEEAVKKTSQRLRDEKMAPPSDHKGKNIPLEFNPLLQVSATAIAAIQQGAPATRNSGQGSEVVVEPPVVASPAQTMSAPAAKTTTAAPSVASVSDTRSCQSMRRSKRQKDLSSVPFTTAPVQKQAIEGHGNHSLGNEHDDYTPIPVLSSGCSRLGNEHDDYTPIPVLSSGFSRLGNEHDDYTPIPVLSSGSPDRQRPGGMGEAELLHVLGWLQEYQLSHASRQAESDRISVGSVKKRNSQRALAASENSHNTLGTFSISSGSSRRLQQQRPFSASVRSELTDATRGTFPPASVRPWAEGDAATHKSTSRRSVTDMSVDFSVLSGKMSAMSINSENHAQFLGVQEERAEDVWES